MRSQLIRDGFGHVAFHRKNVGQFAIVRLRPEMRVGVRVDQLNIHANLIARFLHAALKDIGNAELLRNLAQITRSTFCTFAPTLAR